MKKSNLILIILLVAIALFTGIFSYYSKTKIKPTQTTISQAMLPQSNSDETKDMQLYQNDAEGFKIYFQNYWEKGAFGMEEDSVINFNDLKLYNTESLPHSDAIPLLVFQVLKKEFFPSIESIESAGKNEEFIGNFPKDQLLGDANFKIYKSGNSYSALIVLKNGDIFTIKVGQTTDGEEAKRVLNEILSTFEFLNTSAQTQNAIVSEGLYASTTASWKTYTNNAYGFSFKYPEDTLNYRPDRTPYPLTDSRAKKDFSFDLGTKDGKLVNVRIEANPGNGKMLNQDLKNNLSQFNISSSTINGTAFKKYSMKAGIYNGYNEAYVYENADRFIAIKLINSVLSKQILSTFKVTNIRR